MTQQTSAHPALEQYYAVRRFFGNMDFSPDGADLAYIVDTTGQFNIWKRRLDGGCPTQLTVFEEQTARGVAYSPDGATLLILADQNGDEKHQLYTMPAAGGWPQALTSNPGVQHQVGPYPFSPDGRYIAYASNERSRTEQDVLLLDTQTGESQSIMEDGYLFPMRWSPDGRYLTVLEFRSNTDQDIHLYDLERDEFKNLTQHEGDISYVPGPWRPDSSGFCAVTDRDREFHWLGFLDLATGEIDPIVTPDWDIESVEADVLGRYLAWTVNEGGRSRLYLLEHSSRQPVAAPELPAGSIAALTFSPDGARLAFRFNQATATADVYLFEISTGDITKLTDSMLGGLRSEDMVAPQLTSFGSFDREIPGWLYKPAGASLASPVPCVLSIHGGPEAQERADYSAFYQYLLSRGIGVFAPNIRGSTGYGKSYQTLIHRDWGGNELRDIEAAANYLRCLDWVDGDRLGVYGGSFGGFATLSAVSRLPGYWAAAVDIVGPSNLVTFARSVPPTWLRFMSIWVGDPEADREMLLERSPITYVDSVRAPLLVIQGAQDPRVVKAESNQMVERLKARGVPVEYVVFEDEGHGFTRRKNQIAAFRAAGEFFEKHLLPATNQG